MQSGSADNAGKRIGIRSVDNSRSEVRGHRWAAERKLLSEQVSMSEARRSKLRIPFTARQVLCAELFVLRKRRLRDERETSPRSGSISRLNSFPVASLVRVQTQTRIELQA